MAFPFRTKIIQGRIVPFASVGLKLDFRNRSNCRLFLPRVLYGPPSTDMKARAALLIILIAPALSVDKEADLDGLAKLEPLLDYWIRDTYITYIEGDDTYYMTGTTSDPS